MNNHTIIKWILITALTLLSLKSYAQINPDSTYYKRLYYLCNAWGHVKYYNTEIAKGIFNWDNELLTAINGSKNAASNETFNETIETMINNVGEMGISSVALPNVPDSLNNNLDLSWIYDPIFSETVSAILDTITRRFKPQSNIYVGEAWAGGNPTFDNDDLYYSGTSYPSEYKRLLALFRYWNIIHYFYPYKNIMDQHWDMTLVEFIPLIVEADNALSYHLTFKELTTRINDSHAFFYSSTFGDWNGNYYPPFQVRFIENETVITKVVESETEVTVGDVIKEIDGHNIYELRNSLRKYAHGSNDGIIERTLNSFILWGNSGSFNIKVDNGSEIYTETLTRNSLNYDLLNKKNRPIWTKVTAGNSCYVGIVDMGQLEKEEVIQMFDDLWDTEAIIFDIRNYPNGTLWSIVNYLYPGPINNANFTRPDITYPGRLIWDKAYIGSGTANPYSGKIVILFDERTQSQAEYTIMGLEQFPDATKIGSTTSGADGNVAKIYLPGNIVTYATFLGVFYPDYTPTQRVGIIPDIEVNTTISGIRNRIDEVMHYALNLLNCYLISVNELYDTEIIKLYPNPVSHFLKYELSENQSATISFEIIDIQGRKLKTMDKNTPTGEIDFSNLNSGVYILRLITNKNIMTKRIIKN